MSAHWCRKRSFKTFGSRRNKWLLEVKSEFMNHSKLLKDKN